MSTSGVIIKEYSKESINVVSVSGDVIVLNVQGFEAVLAKVVQNPGGLVVDLRGVDYIDSAGIEQLVVALSKQKEKQERFGVLVKERSQPDEVLRVIQFSTLTTVTSKPDELGLED